MGKILILIGIILIIIGLILQFEIKIPFLGRLPGDFNYKGNNFSFHFPLASSIVISIVISLILLLIRYLKN